MRGFSRASRVAALTVAAALLATACGGDDDGGDAGEQAAEGNPEGSFSAYIGDPENPLVPGNTNETEGGQVVDSLWTGLVQYDNETSEMEMTGVAESIESDDNVTWTITLKEGWTFHDGSPVNAQSFVDAWNYTAYSPNAQGNSYFFERVEGYDQLQAAEEGGQPAAQEMSGLEVVDDLTFTVTLNAPFAIYPITLGYTAFYPLPPAFFEDPQAFGEQPVGNGPFQATAPFVPGQGITLTRFEDYAGENPAQAAEVEYRVYTEQNTAYTDVQAGNLDIVDVIPPDAIGSAPDEFGERYIERERSDITNLNFPTYDQRFADPRVRQAFSLAIDREAVVEAVFQGTREPATSYVNPVIDGFREDACEYCVFDAERAQQLLQESGFDTTQPIDLWFNAGAGHDEWMQAVGNQLRQNLGLEYQLRGDLQFAEYLPLVDERGMTGPFRFGWIMDYPSPQNFLEPLYTTQALPPNGSNSTFYSNPEFDELIAEGNTAESNEEAIEAYQRAEDVLVQDLPGAPLWYGLVQGVHSERTDNVEISAFGRIDAAAVTVTE